MPLILDLNLRLKATLDKVLGGITGSLPVDLGRVQKLLSGVGLNQADKLYYAKPIIAGSATLQLDLAGGGLVDLYGDALAFARVKMILLLSDLALCPNVINLQRPANGVPIYLAAADGEPLRPGGMLLKVWPDATAIAVTAGTGDLIEIVNTAAGNVQPEILIAGASA